MEKSLNPKITIRRSNKFEPLFKRIEEIVAERPGSKLSSTILEMAALGLKYYDEGSRMIDEKLFNINEGKIMNERREVGRSVFTSLAGSLVDIGRYEESKPIPDKTKIEFYQLVRKALYAKHAKFRLFTDEDVEDVFKTLSPILKAIRLAPNKQAREVIVETNRATLMGLIDVTGVRNVA